MLSLSACSNIPIIGNFLGSNFEKQIELLEENGWNDLFSSGGINIIYEFQNDECLVHYCPDDVEQYAIISKGTIFSNFSTAFILEFKSTRIARNVYDSLLDSDNYDSDEVYRSGTVIYIISGSHKDEFVSLLNLRP